MLLLSKKFWVGGNTIVYFLIRLDGKLKWFMLSEPSSESRGFVQNDVEKSIVFVCVHK